MERNVKYFLFQRAIRTTLSFILHAMYHMIQMIKSRSTPISFILILSLLWIGFKLIDVIIWVTYCDLNLMCWIWTVSALRICWFKIKKPVKVFDLHECYKKSSQINIEMIKKCWAVVKLKWMRYISRKETTHLPTIGYQ